MSFGKYVHLCNQCHNQTTEISINSKNSLSLGIPLISWLKTATGLISFLVLHINEVIKYAFHYVWLLFCSIMFFRFILLGVLVVFFYFISEWYSIVWLHHNLFSNIWLLWIKLIWTFGYRSLYSHDMCFHLSWVNTYEWRWCVIQEVYI